MKEGLGQGTASAVPKGTQKALTLGPSGPGEQRGKCIAVYSQRTRLFLGVCGAGKAFLSLRAHAAGSAPHPGVRGCGAVRKAERVGNGNDDVILSWVRGTIMGNSDLVPAPWLGLTRQNAKPAVGRSRHLKPAKHLRRSAGSGTQALR